MHARTMDCRIVGEIQNNKLTAKELAKEVGWNDKYLSQVLNGENLPKGAEQKLKDVLRRILDQRNGTEITYAH